MDIISDSKNDLLKRRELVLELSAPKTPSFEEAAKMVAEQFKADAECVVVKSIVGGFGKSSFKLSVFIYSGVSEKQKYEPKPKVKKDAGGAK